MSNVEDALKPEFPEDIKTLRREIPKLRRISDPVIERLWADFSDKYYSAGWMIVSELSLVAFKKWLEE